MRIAVLAVILALPAAAQPFGRWYGEALSGNTIVDMDEGGAALLERALAANPEDQATRLKLMAYHQRADRASIPEDRAKLVRHVLWLIERHPDSELLHSFVSRVELPAAEYRRAVALWDAAPKNAAVLWNMVTFFSGIDPLRHLRALEAGVALDPEKAPGIRTLAFLYASEILERGPLAAAAQAGLDASKNRWVLGNAAYMFQSQYNRKIQMGESDPRAAQLAERYFSRAKAIDPNLDRAQILPQLDLPAIAREHAAREKESREAIARARDGLAKVRRLTAEAFPQLPAAIAGVMRARRCTVPQPQPDGPAKNVIRGEFFRKGESGWALFCEVGNTTSLLAFRNEDDTNPDTVSTYTGENLPVDLGGDRWGYTNQLYAAQPEDMLRRYRIGGGPVAPPFDHEAIDDGFLDKGSARWYFRDGKWLAVPGSD